MSIIAAASAGSVSPGLAIKTALHGAKEMWDLVRTPAPWAPYVGPGTSSNAGDFLLHRAYELLCNPISLPVLSGRKPQLLSLARSVSPGPEAVILGGGTLIGSERHRRPLERVLRAFPYVPLAVMGTGVDGLTSRRLPGKLGLEAWRPLLERAPQVGVRGPLSAGLLSEVGIHARVVGDAALFLGPRRPQPVTPGLIGVCVGGSGRMHGGLDSVVKEVATAVSALSQEGFAVRYLVVWPPDYQVVRDIVTRSSWGIPAEIVTFERSRPWEFLSALWCAEVVVSMKLHGAILANAALIPTVMLAYQDKCVDHHMAVGRDGYTIKTSEVSAAAILDLIQTSLSDVRAREELAVRIRRLRAAWTQLARQALPGAGC